MVEWHDDPKTEIVPVVPLRDSVLLPKSIVPVLIGRSKSLAAVEHAQEEKTRVFFVLQKDPEIEDPVESDLHRFGVLGYVEQVLPAEDGLQRILVNLEERAWLRTIISDDPFFMGKLEIVPYKENITDSHREKIDNIIKEFKLLVNKTKILPPEILFSFVQQE